MTFPSHGGAVAGVPPGSIDLVVTFRNLHNWMADGTAPDALATIFKALKPGGVLGVVDHRGNPAIPQDPKAKSGYVVEDYAIKLIEAQGFGSSARPRSTPTRKTPRTTNKVCGPCPRPIGWVTRTVRSMPRSGRATALR